MKVMFGVGRVKPALTNTVAAIGIFDGVHTGHQALIRRMVRTARRKNMKSLVITFHPHPVEVLQKKEVNYLVSFDGRVKLLESLGVDLLLVIKFTKQFSRLKPEEFVKKYLVASLGVKEVFVGDDFRFGENRTGDVELFGSMGQRYGFVVRHIDPVKKTKNKISSSWLRQLIIQGKLREAAAMLGRNVSVAGDVIKGRGLGKKFGFPTANINVTSGILPSNGVYFVRACLAGRSLSGVCNIGSRPTVSSAPGKVSLEVHILNFNEKIYKKELTIEFLHRVRNEKKFSSVDLLVSQIRADVRRAYQYFQISPK